MTFRKDRCAGPRYHLFMDLQSLVDTYGYLAVFVGAFLEGETVLAMAGVAAHFGYLELPIVIVIALAGGFLGDQCFFFLGRWQGKRLLVRFPKLQQRATMIDLMLARYHAPLIVAIRFMYGFRIAGPILIGMGRVSAPRFMFYNFIGACLWAPLIAGLGYFFGQVLATLLKQIYQYEVAGLVTVTVTALGIWAFFRLRERRKKRRKKASSPED
jgi:membrane protein DedA with SNARE-associated domain